MQSLFNVPKGIYLLSHSVGCLPTVAETHLLEHYLGTWKVSGGNAWPNWLSVIDGFNHQLTKLLGGNADEFCPQSNLSSGLTKYLTALPVNKTKNKILMHGSAFPSIGFVVQCLKQFGYELKLIDEHFSPTDLNVWQDQLGPDVAATLITHVHSNTGVVSPVAEIAKLCRDKDIKVMVDVAQSAGILSINLEKWQADVVFGSCVKWLCGGPGAGFIWLNPSTIASLLPIDAGWFSHENPFEFDIRHFDYATNAKRFWGGTPSIAPYALAQGSLLQINQIGVDAVYAHNRLLLKTVLETAQPWLLNDIDLENNGGTLCLALEKMVAEKIENKLQQVGGYFDRRENTIRLSFHIYNTLNEAEQVSEMFTSL